MINTQLLQTVKSTHNTFHRICNLRSNTKYLCLSNSFELTFLLLPLPFMQLHFLLLMTTVATIQMTAPKGSTTLVDTIMAILLSVYFHVVLVIDVDVSFTLKKKKITSVSIVIVFLEIEVTCINCREQKTHARCCIPEFF